MLGLDTKPQFIKYRLWNNRRPITVVFADGEVWLNQNQVAELYKLQLSTVNEHLRKITVSDGPYPAKHYARRFRTPGKDGKLYEVWHYRLEAVEALSSRTRKSSL